MITSRILSLILSISALTQNDLAEKIGVTQAALSRYINGEREIPHEVAVKVTKLIGQHNLFLIQTFDSGLNAVGADINGRVKGRD
ncbi:XRE family transcriptional regulator [Bacillus mycoides]|uniref:helix-turn-helix domain-containing protein n=1 Tax=Bacillus mycoides TaxID=1405 RepID=UPI001C035A02|nr:helix-turn-helix transcriptional regulator [Bacillus mycoides]QWH19215.1 XRE family transcriptional regulator [Bacillus mycoides]